LKKNTKRKDAREPWFDGSSPIYIYGTGTFAEDVYRACAEKGLYVSAFLDHRSSAAKFLHGVPVMLPESAHDAVVIIGIHNREADVVSIIQRLEGYSVTRIISPMEIYTFLGDLLGMRYWLTNPIFYENCKPVIEKAYLLLADDVSRNLYRSILEFRLTGDYKVLPAPDLDHRYFSQDIPSWAVPLRQVDCGAFDGDTLADFVSDNIEIEGVAAFEPDPVNFTKLSQYVSLLKNKISEAILFPCGVYSSTQQMTFEMNRGEASSISNKGGVVVQCVALDDVIPTFAPQFDKDGYRRRRI